MARTAIQLKNKDILRLRAMEMLQLRVKGTPVVDIAFQYNCSTATVQRALAYASREGLVEKYENEMIANLVPLAMKAYERSLSSDEPDLFAAKDVMSMMMKLGDRFAAQEAKSEELDLAAYLQGVKEKTVEGEVIKNGNNEGDEADSAEGIVQSVVHELPEASSSDE